MATKKALKNAFIEDVSAALAGMGFDQRSDRGRQGEFWFLRPGGSADLSESVSLTFIPGRLGTVGVLCTIAVLSDAAGDVSNEIPDAAKLVLLVGEEDTGEYYSTVDFAPAASLDPAVSGISGPEFSDVSSSRRAVEWITEFVSSKGAEWYKPRRSLDQLLELVRIPTSGSADNINPRPLRATIILAILNGNYPAASELIEWYGERSNYNFFDSQERFARFRSALEERFPALAGG
ncbi:hypothetical protein [Nocardia asteroides]